MNKVKENLKKNLINYILIILLSFVLSSYLTRLATNPKQEEKIVIYITYSYSDKELLNDLYDEDIMEGILGIELSFPPEESYLGAFYQSYKSSEIDLIIVSSEEVNAFIKAYGNDLESFDSDLSKEVYKYNDVIYGFKLSNDFDKNSELDYYVLLRNDSIHISSINDISVDDYAIYILNLLTE